MNKPHENEVLLSEVKKALDHQLETLDFPVQSRLTQARFHAIDKGLLSSTFKDHRYSLARGVALGGALVLAFVFTLSSTHHYSGKKTIHADLRGHSTPNLIDNGKVRTVESSEDTKEEIEIYNWLYEQYG